MEVTINLGVTKAPCAGEAPPHPCHSFHREPVLSVTHTAPALLSSHPLPSTEQSI